MHCIVCPPSLFFLFPFLPFSFPFPRLLFFISLSRSSIRSSSALFTILSDSFANSSIKKKHSTNTECICRSQNSPYSLPVSEGAPSPVTVPHLFQSYPWRSTWIPDECVAVLGVAQHHADNQVEEISRSTTEKRKTLGVSWNVDCCRYRCAGYSSGTLRQYTGSCTQRSLEVVVELLSRMMQLQMLNKTAHQCASWKIGDSWRRYPLCARAQAGMQSHTCSFSSRIRKGTK